jgi:hypothetical protein
MVLTRREDSPAHLLACTTSAQSRVAESNAALLQHGERVARPLCDHAPLELVDGCHHVREQLARGCRGVHVEIERADADAALTGVSLSAHARRARSRSKRAGHAGS